MDAQTSTFPNLRRRFSLPMCAKLAALLLLPTLTSGCLFLAFGGAKQRDSEDPSLFTQTGKAMVQAGEEFDVYYPVPFASPPNLEIKNNGLHAHVVVDQKADHFRVRNNGRAAEAFGRPPIDWTARGVRVPAPVTTPAPVTVSTATQ
jgi:hypothetical protein